MARKSKDTDGADDDRSTSDDAPAVLIDDEPTEASQPVDIPEPSQAGSNDAGESEAEPEVPEAVAGPSRRNAQRSGLGIIPAMLAGGLLAGAAGFVIGKIDPASTWPFADWGPQIASVESEAASIGGRLSDLSGEVAALRQAQDELAGLVAGVESRAPNFERLEALWTELDARLIALGARVTDLENRPVPDVGATQDAVAAYERELANMRGMFEAELERIAAAQKETAELQVAVVDTGRIAAIQNGLGRLEQDVRAGGSIAAGIDQLRSAGVELPPGLAGGAGLAPGLSRLRDAYPDAAREALVAALRQQAEAGEIGRVEAFLKIQLGMRSLEPREGNDPDAILARAEAALLKEDLTGALNELAAFPATDAPLLGEWVAMAERQRSLMIEVEQLGKELLGGGAE